MFDTNLTDLEYNILRFVHDNPDGVIQEEFTGRLAAEHYIFGPKEPEYNEARDKLFRYGCLTNNWIPPSRKICITPRGEEVYQSEKARRENSKEISDVRIVLDKKTLERTEQDLRMGYWLWKTKWWPLRIAAGSLIAASISAIYAVYAYSLSVQSEKRIQKQQEQSMSREDLEKRLQETRHAAYKYSDSLWKTRHEADTAKR